MAAADRPRPLDATAGRWLSLATAVTLLPHAQFLPIWLSVVSALLLLWRAAIDHRAGALPPKWLLLLLAVGVVAGTAVEYRHLMGKDPGLALLAGFACLKLLEARQVRDGRASVLLCFFLQMGQFLNGQEIPVAVVTALGTLLALGSLGVMEQPAGARAQLKASASLLALAAPFMLALFVLFPRIQGPLWGLPADAFSSLTGLSETMSPGSIGRLIQSGKIAFRAEFDGPAPPPRERYWRGPVLSNFDGRTWKPGFSTLTSTPPHDARGPVYAYRMTVEPHNQHWLLALDLPFHEGSDTRYSSELQLVAVAPLQVRRRFDLRAYPAAGTAPSELVHVVRRNLALPAGHNPRTVEFGRRIAAAHTDLARRVDALVSAFRDQGLKYTLAPPLLGEHASDEFFFDTRQGFCEHFASSFAIAARAAGIPSRVVTGYQGGEINPHDGSLVVRQSDAHAWVEVWLPGRGWLRVDPTAAANPTRIDSGIAGALPDSPSLPFFMQSEMAWLRALQFRWEAMSNTWNQWVIGYNEERQRQLLRGLGFEFESYHGLMAALLGVAGALILALIAWSLRGARRLDEIDRQWRRFCDKLARAGTPRPSWQGPLDFARSAAARHPSAAEQISRIAQAYACMRYGPGGGKEALSALRHMINTLELR